MNGVGGYATIVFQIIFSHYLEHKISPAINNFGYWQFGYGALSLSEKGIPFVKRYIANQKQHHARDSLLHILEYTPLDES